MFNAPSGWAPRSWHVGRDLSGAHVIAAFSSAGKWNGVLARDTLYTDTGRYLLFSWLSSSLFFILL
jgi:hypothetical protein